MTSPPDQSLTEFYQFERDNIKTPERVRNETWNRLMLKLAPNLIQFDTPANGQITPRFHGLKVDFDKDIADGDFKWVM